VSSGDKRGPLVVGDADPVAGSPYDKWARKRVDDELSRTQSVSKSRALYSDDDGKPVLRESWVAYMDLLGTTDAVRALDDR
jgi:hypothetical protein